MCKILRCPNCKAVRGPGGEDDRLRSEEKPLRIPCKEPGKKGRCRERDVWSEDARSEKERNAFCPKCGDAQRREYLDEVMKHRKKEKWEAEEAEDPEKMEARKARKRESTQRHKKRVTEKDPDALNRAERERYNQQNLEAVNQERRKRYRESKRKKDKGDNQTASGRSLSSDFKGMNLATAGGPRRITQPLTQRDDRDTTRHQRLDFILGSSSSSRSNSSSSGEEERPPGRGRRQSRPSAPFSQRSSDDPNRRQRFAGGPSQTTDFGLQDSQSTSHGPESLYIREGPMGRATYDRRPANLADIENERRRQQPASDNPRRRHGDGAPSYGVHPAPHTSHSPYDHTRIQEESLLPSEDSRQVYPAPSSFEGYGRQRRVGNRDERSREFQGPEYDQGGAPPEYAPQEYSWAPQPPMTGQPRLHPAPRRSDSPPPPKYSKHDTSRGGKR